MLSSIRRLGLRPPISDPCPPAPPACRPPPAACPPPTAFTVALPFHSISGSTAFYHQLLKCRDLARELLPPGSLQHRPLRKGRRQIAKKLKSVSESREYLTVGHWNLKGNFKLVRIRILGYSKTNVGKTPQSRRYYKDKAKKVDSEGVQKYGYFPCRQSCFCYGTLLWVIWPAVTLVCAKAKTECPVLGRHGKPTGSHRNPPQQRYPTVEFSLHY